MGAIATSLIVVAVVLVAGIIGSQLRKVVPMQELSGESWSMASVGVGFISTMAAIALGLLVASAKSSYDTKDTELQQAVSRVLVLDRTLRQYGPEAQPARALLRKVLNASFQSLWGGDVAPAGGDGAAVPPALYGYEQMEQSVRALSPANDLERALQTRALQTIDQFAQIRWLFVAQSTAGVSMPLLIALVSWLAVIAGCAGLFAPRNGTLFAVAVLCALSISGTIFLIMSMYDPFGGVLTLSSGPMQKAMQIIAQP